MIKILVCGTRMPDWFSDSYWKLVKTELERDTLPDFEIIEGCCKGSADEHAEWFAYLFGTKITHFPATSNNYLKRNIEMVNECDMVLAFYNGWSYGTAHTIANAVMRGKLVTIIPI